MSGSEFRDRLCVARLSPPGRGAVATIRVCADHPRMGAANERDAGLIDSSQGCHLAVLNSLFRAANGISLSEQPVSRVVFGHWGMTHPEDLLICRRENGAVEIHCHGGDAAVNRILDDLTKVGCRIVTWQDQLRLHSEFETECREALSNARTWRSARILLEQTQGVLREAYERLGQLDRTRTGSITSEVDALLAWSQFGLHLSTSWSVVLTGRPNVGKSSLINSLLGFERAIVFDEPGTTRDVVTGETAFDGWAVTLSDTAGIRQPGSELEAIGIDMARRQLQTADLRIVVLDTSQPPSDEDFRLLDDNPNSLTVASKSDLRDRWDRRLPADALRISTVTGEGVPELQRRIVNQLVPYIPPRGTAIPVAQRQVSILRSILTTDSLVARETFVRSLLE